MTVNSLETKVRDIINDAVEEYRWSGEKIRGYLQLAMRRLNAKAQQTRYMADGTIVDEVEVPQSDERADEELPVANRYEEALAYYAAHLCYLRDDPDTANAELANAYFAKAEAMMT